VLITNSSTTTKRILFYSITITEVSGTILSYASGADIYKPSLIEVEEGDHAVDGVDADDVPEVCPEFLLVERPNPDDDFDILRRGRPLPVRGSHHSHL